MDPKLQEQLDEQEIKINQIYESVKKTERYMRLTFWVTIGIIVLPLLLSLFIIPPLISSFSGSLDGLTEVYQF
jgi:Na+-driven multidrug efflux pump